MKLLILEPITADLAKNVIEQVAANTDDVIDVLIMSPGGDVFAGNAIISALNGSPATINTRVIGVAASMAAVISQVGKNREIDSDATFNLHFGSIVMQGRGTTENHEKAIAILDSINKMMLTKLKGNLNKGQLKALLSEDRLMTAKEAVSLGFFNAITEPLKAVALLTNTQNMETIKQKSIIAQAKALLGISDPVDDEQKKLVEDMLKASEKKAKEDAAKAVADAAGAEGAEILTAKMVKNEDFLAYKNIQTPLMASLLNLLEEIMSSEETKAFIKVESKAAVEDVLKNLKSQSTAPRASTFTVEDQEEEIKDDHSEWNKRQEQIQLHKA